MSFKEFKPSSWAIDNRTAVYVFTIIVALAGIFTYTKLPKEQFPDIVVPTIYVSTIYPGTSPEDMENLISKPIEKQLKSVQGVKKITSTSISDFSAVIVEFNTGIPVAVCKQRVADAVDKSKNELPNDLDKDPMVQEVDFSEFPIMQVNVAGNIPLDKLKKFAERIQDDIEALPEITRADVIGAPDREIQVDVNLFRMQAAGITFSDISNAIARENINISGGELKVEDIRRTLRVTGEFRKVSEIGEIVVRSSRGNTKFLKEIAEVRDGFKEKQDYARLDGNPVITLNIIKRSGANLIEASDKTVEAVRVAQSSYLPSNVKVVVTGERSEFTKTQLNDLINSVIIGFIIVTIVLMFFMGITNAVFVGLSVPIAVLVAFLCMPALDYSLNMIVMFSFLLALGIVVDDAIVVIENTHRLLHKHPEWGVAKAAKVAVGEVFYPVLAGTLTTIAPFFPLLFWPGLIGEFMKYLPVTLIITLFASLFVAFIMNTVFAVSFMKQDDDNPNATNWKKVIRNLVVIGVITVIAYQVGAGPGNFMLLVAILYLFNIVALRRMIFFFQNTILPAFMRGYRGMLEVIVKGYRPVFVVLAAVALLFLSFVVTGIVKPKVNFFPDNEPNFVYVYNVMPIGTDASVTDSVTKLMERRVYKVIGQNNPLVKSVISNVGIGAGDPQNPDRTTTPHKSKITVAFVEYSHRNGQSTNDILENIRKEMVGIPGTQITVDKEKGGPPVEKPINIEIAGEDFKVLQDIEKQMVNLIQSSGIKGIEDLQSNLKLNKPEIIIDIDREKANREGINTATIALDVRSALYGKEAARYRDSEDDYPIMVRVDPELRQQLDDLLGVNIAYLDMATGRFRSVPLSSFVTVRYSSSYSTINRKNLQRTATLSSNVVSGYNANEIVASIKQLIPKLKLPSGYTVKLTGEQEQQEETGSFLAVAFLGAILLIFLVLVVQFNSVSKPFIIFGTVVLSLIGVLLGFAIFDMTYSIVITGVGIISLAGIVVKNGILLIEFTDELRKRGYTLREAIIEGGSTRLTPVLLTAASTVLGLIPLAVGVNVNFATLFTQLDPQFYIGGDSGMFWGPLAWAIIYGLSFATVLTLIVVPCAYYLIERLKFRVFPKLREKEALLNKEHNILPEFGPEVEQIEVVEQ